MAKGSYATKQILNWMEYFSKEMQVSPEKIKLLDICGKQKNVIPTVEGHKRVLIFADESHEDLFYDFWEAGFTDDGIPIMDEKILVQAMEKAKELDLPVSLHEEDPAFIASPGVHQGEVSRQLGYGGASRTAEDVMVARDCALALHTGAAVCIQHISSKNAVEYVRTAKKLGADVHAEATPHHFTLTDKAVLEYGTLARMNPPVRTEEDRLKIIEGIKDGTIDMIVTDHAPHSTEEKAR